MNRDLFLSILAMDSYNRGYGQGLILNSDDSTTNQNEIGRALGLATIIEQNATQAARAAGFYALAYDWNGETVISYRGTDFDLGRQMVRDVSGGWSSFTGIGTNTQFGLARQFFTAVTGAGFPVGTASGPANVTLTGHSLGGALAGYVGARGLPASTVAFNPIPYGTLTWNDVVIEAFNVTVAQLSLSRPGIVDQIQSAVLLQTIAGTNTTWSTFFDQWSQNIEARKPDLKGIDGYFTEGEIATSIPFYQSIIANFFQGLGPPFSLLGYYQAGQAYSTMLNEDRSGLQQISNVGLGSSIPFFGQLSAIELHGMSLTTILMYGSLEADSGAWRDSASLMFKALHQAEVADSLPDVNARKGIYATPDVMRAMIAYSAIDEGERPFGDTGIRAFFDDASDLGRAVKLEATGFLKDRDQQEALAKIATQYAGALALYDVELFAAQQVSDGLNPLSGVLSGAVDGRVVGVDLSKILWSDVLRTAAEQGRRLPGGDPLTPIGGDEFRTAYFSWAGLDEAALSEYSALWETSVTAIFDRLHSTTRDDDQTIMLSERGYDRGDETGDDAHVDVYVGAGGKDTVTGTEGGDLMLGRGGDDRLDGGKGIDWVLGEAGDDRLVASLDGADDVLDGGEGEDTVVFRFENPLESYEGYGGTTSYHQPVFIRLAAPTSEAGEDGVLDRADFGVEILGLVDDDFGRDGLVSIEKLAIEAGPEGNTVMIENDVDPSLIDYIDFGAEPSSGEELFMGDDLLDLSNWNDGVTVELSLNRVSLKAGLFGGARNFEVRNAEVIWAGDGDDVLVAGNVPGKRYRLYGGAGDDVITGGAGDDSLDGGDGIDTISGGRGADFISGNDGADSLHGDGGDDVIIGDAGDDQIDGGDGHDSIAGGRGNDTINGGNGDDYIEGNGTTFADSEYETLRGGAGNDTILRGATISFQYGDAGNDKLVGNVFRPADEDVAYLYGGDGDDELFGGYRDYLSGGQGSDFFDVSFGGTILDIDFEDRGIHFSDFNAFGILRGGRSTADPSFFQDYTNNFSYLISGTTLSVWRSFGDGSYERRLTIQNFVNGEGGIWLGNQFLGSDASETLLGDSAPNILFGGRGDDLLIGGEGDDTYVFSLGDGVDTISDPGSGNSSQSGMISSSLMRATSSSFQSQSGGSDTIQFMGGILSSTLQTYLTSTDLIIKIAGTADQITIRGALITENNRIESVRFQDGTVWTHQDLVDRAIPANTAPAGVTLSNNAVDENAAARVVVGRLSAIDSDVGDTHTFRVVAASVRLDEALRYDPSAPIGVPFTGTDTGQNNTGLRLTSMGRYAGSNAQGAYTVWRIRNTNATAQTVRLNSASGVFDRTLMVAPGTDTYVLSTDIAGSAPQRLYRGTTLIDTKASATYAFSASNLVDIVNPLFEVVGNELRVKSGANLDFERIGTVSVAIEATDAAGAKVTQTLPVSLNDLFDYNAITGTASNDTLTGTAFADRILGLAGNDRLTGGAGNDSLDGGTGNDVAVFAGLQASYSIVTSQGKTTIVDNAPATDGNDGTDTLFGIEKAEFKGGVQVGIAAPIVLDLSGNGVGLVDQTVSRVSFDWDGDGRADRTAWASAADGFLAYDRNGDGTIGGADELSFTGDRPGAKSDLDGLTAFDSNGDGRFSALDAKWSSFMVWRDANQNGLADRGELKSLAQQGIASIDLKGSAVDKSWSWGQAITVNTGSFSWNDGRTGSFSDVALSYAPGAGRPPAAIKTMLIGHAGARGLRWSERGVGAFDIDRFEQMLASDDASVAVSRPAGEAMAEKQSAMALDWAQSQCGGSWMREAADEGVAAFDPAVTTMANQLVQAMATFGSKAAVAEWSSERKGSDSFDLAAVDRREGVRMREMTSLF